MLQTFHQVLEVASAIRGLCIPCICSHTVTAVINGRWLALGDLHMTLPLGQRQVYMVIAGYCDTIGSRDFCRGGNIAVEHARTCMINEQNTCSIIWTSDLLVFGIYFSISMCYSGIYFSISMCYSGHIAYNLHVFIISPLVCVTRVTSHITYMCSLFLH